MPSGTQEQLFRLQLIFLNELEDVQAIPVVCRQMSGCCEVMSGVVRGRDNLARMISDVEIDSIVETRQVHEMPLQFERTFHVHSADEIVNFIEKRAKARQIEDLKMLESSDPDISAEAIQPAFGRITLGSTRLLVLDGIHRTNDWFLKQLRTSTD